MRSENLTINTLRLLDNRNSKQACVQPFPHPNSLKECYISHNAQWIHLQFQKPISANSIAMWWIKIRNRHCRKHSFNHENINYYSNIWSLEILKEAFTVILSPVCKNVCISFICGFSTFKQHSVHKYNWQIVLRYMAGGCAPFQILEWCLKHGDNISGMTIVSVFLWNT